MYDTVPSRDAIASSKHAVTTDGSPSEPRGGDRASRAPASRVTFGWALLLAVVLALLTGLAQGAWELSWARLASRIIWRPREILWMAPVAYLPPFVVLALLLVSGVALLRLVGLRLSERRLVAGAQLFLATYALALLAPRVHPLAHALFALGVAVQASGVLARWSTRALARAGGALGAVVIVVAAGTLGWRAVSERRALAALPPAAAGAPNVLLIILDTVRAADLSLYGFARATTPKLERWAAQGTVFDHAFSVAPWTLPSHASMFTGHLPDSLSSDERTPLDARHATLAERFRERGYATGGFVANTYYTARDAGLSRGFAHYEDYRLTRQQVLWSSTLAQIAVVESLVWAWSWQYVKNKVREFDLTMEPLHYAHRKPGRVVSDQFLRWQEEQRGRPFFAFLNYFDAHDPYQPTADYKTRFAAKPTEHDRYHACLAMLDDELDRLFAELSRRGVLDKTVVMVSSDHGEGFGEHGHTRHGNSLHTQLTRVPLLVRYPPNVPAGVRVDSAVSITEIGATLLDVAGGTDQRFPGRSLARFWTPGGSHGGASLPVYAALEHFHEGREPRHQRRVARAVVSGDLHFIRMANGKEELYAFRADPAEERNLIRVDSLRARVDSLRAVAERPIGPATPSFVSAGARLTARPRRR